MRCLRMTFLAMLFCLGSADLQGKGDPQEGFIYMVRIPATKYHKAAIQTGFRLRGMKGIMTALHGVADGAVFSALNEDGDTLNDLTIAGVDVANDLALLRNRQLLDRDDAGLVRGEIATLSVGAELRVWGHPVGINLYSKRVRAGNPVIKALSDLIPPAAAQAFAARRSPEVGIRVLSIDGNVVAGDSGAPVLDSQSHVIGVADGGLLGGAAGIAWAIPISSIRLKPFASVAANVSALAATPSVSLFAFTDISDEVANRKKDDKWAFRLGRNAAWLSRFALIAHVNETEPHGVELKASYNNKRTEMNAALVELGIRVESARLDFTSVTHLYDDSPGEKFLSDLVKWKKGNRAMRAYALGLQLEAFYWVAEDKGFTWAATGGMDALTAVNALNAQAREFGVEPVDLPETVNEGNVNLVMRLLTTRLGNNIAEALN